MYRQNITEEFGDQRVTAELLLNASQCDLSNRALWNQTEITRWFSKVSFVSPHARSSTRDHLALRLAPSSASLPASIEC